MKRCLARFGWLLVIFPLLAVGAGGVPLADNLQREAARHRHAPVLLFFASEDCPYCAIVENDHLAPMMGSRELAGKVVIRKIDIDRAHRLIDFQGRATTHREFAARLRARFTPTLRLFGPGGTELAEAIIGYNTPELFGGRITSAIEEAGDLLRRRSARCQKDRDRC